MKKIILKTIYRILAYYARKVINKKNPFIIAITGSVGKTSTKEAVFKVLHDKYGNDVRKNFGNLNAEIGIPLTILGYEKLPNKFLWPIFFAHKFFHTFLPLPGRKNIFPSILFFRKRIPVRLSQSPYDRIRRRYCPARNRIFHSPSSLRLCPCRLR